MITRPNPYLLSLSQSFICCVTSLEAVRLQTMAMCGDTAALTNNTPSCTISPCASSPTSVSCNYILPLVSASPAPTRPATAICARIRQIKKYNVRESAISCGYWMQSVVPRASRPCWPIVCGVLIMSQPSQPPLPAEWKTGQS